MKQTRQRRVTAIQTTTAEIFNRLINAELEQHENAQITFVTSIPFTAYVEYEITAETPETLAEAYEMKGDARACNECPYFIRTKDKRFKWHFCAQKQKRVTEYQGACETYYQLLEELIADTMKEATK